MSRQLSAVFTVVALSFVLVGSSGADKPKKTPVAADPPAAAETAPKPTAATPTPEPGGCAYALPGVKFCSTVNGVGSFDVYTVAPAAVRIVVDDPITSITPPDPRFYETEEFDEARQSKGPIFSFSVIPVAGVSLPQRAPLVVGTATSTITISLRPGSIEKVDTQITIKNPNRDRRKSEIDAKVKERTDELEADYQKRLETLNAQAQRRAEELLLDDLAGGRYETRALGKRNDNADQVVLIGERVVRVGDRRYLIVTLDNTQTDKTFTVANVTVTVSEGGAKGRPLAVQWRFTRTTIEDGQAAQGAILLPFRKPPSAKARFTVRIEEADPEHSVELGGLQVP
jgi:hypothetical protein